MKEREIFLIFAQNIDCGYTLEPHLCLEQNIRKYCIPLLTQFYYTKRIKLSIFLKTVHDIVVVLKGDTMLLR